MSDRPELISVIVPAFNEADNVPIVTESVLRSLRGLGPYEIIFIDDGSTDATLDRIKEMARSDGNIKFISFARNFGHQKALMAGIDHAGGDCVISLDADMQHPPELIPTLVEKWREGYDIVYTIRQETVRSGLVKRMTSRYFYALMNRICDVEIPEGSADFRLLDKKVVTELRRFKENWIFVRGIIAWLGFRQTGVEYVAQERHAGVSKYSLRRMLSLAGQGITSFSIVPLRLATALGLSLSVLSFLYAAYALFEKLFFGTALVGWASVLVSVLFLGGVQLIFLGILGEYLGKMFIETKNRPTYVIAEKNL